MTSPAIQGSGKEATSRRDQRDAVPMTASCRSTECLVKGSPTPAQDLDRFASARSRAAADRVVITNAVVISQMDPTRTVIAATDTFDESSGKRRQPGIRDIRYWLTTSPSPVDAVGANAKAARAELDVYLSRSPPAIRARRRHRREADAYMADPCSRRRYADNSADNNRLVGNRLLPRPAPQQCIQDRIAVAGEAPRQAQAARDRR